MSRTVDDRVVEMKFDNASFEAGVNSTLKNLDKFKSSLNFSPQEKNMQDLEKTSESVFSKLRHLFEFSGPKQGINDIQKTVDNFSPRAITQGIEGISKSFLAMSTVAVTALANITTQAISTGISLAKNLTIDPIKSGLQEYETNLNSIQTILANTEVSGATLDDVSAALDELNHFSDLTIFNFSEMTRNIGTFTAAGVDLKTAVASIKGIANLAALSGSNSQQASSAMYQLSQAISAGRVSLQDWNSVVNAGMGGTVFQRALAKTAVAMGKIDSTAVTLEGTMQNVKINGQSFRESIDATNGPSWLSGDVLTNTLKQFTNDLTDAELAAQGFSEADIMAIQKTAKTAFHAATEVKTLSSVLDTARESAGSGWSATWRLIFGDFAEAKSSFTQLSNFLNGMIGRSADARNAMLQLWKSLGGRDVAIDGLKEAFKSLLTILVPIKEAFRDIFPAKTGEDLFNLTVKFREFAKNLAIGSDTAESLKSIFTGVFAVFKLGKQVIAAILSGFAGLFNTVGAGGSSLLTFLVSIGNVLAEIQKSGVIIDIISNAFRILGSVLKPIQAAFLSVFSFETSSSNLGDLITRIKEFVQNIQISESNLNSIKLTFLGLFSIIKIGISLILVLVKTVRGLFDEVSTGGNFLITFIGQIGAFFAKLERSNALVDIFSSALRLLGEIIKPIGQAFRDIFPAKAGDGISTFTNKLLKLIEHFRDFIVNLKLSDSATDNIRRTFRGIFAVFSIGIEIVKQLFGVIKNLFTSSDGFGNPGGGILAFTAKIGDFLVKLNEAIKSGEGFSHFFDRLENVLKKALGFISGVGSAIARLFGFNVDSSQITGAFDSIKDHVTPLSKIIDRIQSAWAAFVNKLKNSGIDLSQIGSKISGAFSAIGAAISQTFANADYGDILATINTGLFAGLVLMFKNFTKNGASLGIGDLIGSIKDRFDALTASTKAMTTQVKAKTLLTIAIAIGILAASVLVLSTIDGEKLQISLQALAVGFGELLAAMTLLTKISATGGFLKVPFIAASLILLGGAILILTFAVKKLSELNQEELKKGLIGVSILLADLAAVSLVLSATSGGMIRAGAGILLLSIALLLLQKSISYFIGLDYNEIKKGLIGITATLVGIALAMRLMPKGMVLQATAILILGAALKVLASVVKDFSEFNWQDMVKGLTGLIGALVGIAIAMNLMPKGMILQAVALVILSGALKIIAGVIKDFGNMDWSQIAKGLLTLAGALTILVIATNAMSGSIAGAVAMVIVAGALKILISVLQTIATLSVGDIVKGLLTLAGVFAVIGVAGLLLAPIVPILLGLGAAIALIGLGVGLAGAGLLAFATAFTLLVSAATAGTAVLTAFLGAIIVAIPAFLTGLAKGLISFATTIAEGTPRLIVAFVQVLSGLLDAVVKIAPKLLKVLGIVLDNVLKFIVKYAPKMAEAGLKLIVSLLEVFAKQIGPITRAAVDFVVKLAEALGKQAPRLANAALQLIVDLLNGIAKAIDTYLPQIIQAGVRIGVSIVTGVLKGLAGGVLDIGKAAINLGKSAIKSLGHAIGFGSPAKEFIPLGKSTVQGFVLGLLSMDDLVNSSGEKFGASVLVAVKDSLSGVSDAAVDEINLNPVIAPVVDLTQVQRGALAINGMLDSTKLAPVVTLNRAIALESNLDQSDGNAILPPNALVNQPAKFEFNQYNNSPKPLSTADIYRNTRNQLALAREAV